MSDTQYFNSGRSAALAISAATTIKVGPGRVVRLIVTTAGAAGTVNDCAKPSDAAAGNLVAVIPAAVGPVMIDVPCQVGITITPGAAQVLSVTFD